MIRQTALVFVASFMVTSVAMGAAPVSDATSDRLDKLESQLNAAGSDNLPEQILSLQEEVQTLRGMVEVNEHQINQLNDRVRDLYSDLDSRINELKPAASASGQAIPPTSDAEKTLYNSAYDLMQVKQYDEAINAFNKYVTTYPNGKYAANSYYWIGETELIGKDLDAAKQAFQNILSKYPTHQKSSDALLKLGFVYDAAGQKDKALKTLNEVTQKYPGSSVARIAEQRIQSIKQRG